MAKVQDAPPTVQAPTAFVCLASFPAVARSNKPLAPHYSPRLIFDRILPDVAAVRRGPRRAYASCFPAKNLESSWNGHLLRRFEFRRLDAAIYQQAVHAV